MTMTIDIRLFARMIFPSGFQGILTSKPRKRATHKLESQEPSIHIGKKGVSQEIVAEIDRQLEKRQKVKVKILKTALRNSNVKIIADQIAQGTQSTVMSLRGHTFTIQKKEEAKP